MNEVFFSADDPDRSIQPVCGKKRLDELIKHLKLSHLEHESGLFVVENISKQKVEAADGKSQASNCIYYALTKEYPHDHPALTNVGDFADILS